MMHTTENSNLLVSISLRFLVANVYFLFVGKQLFPPRHKRFHLKQALTAQTEEDTHSICADSRPVENVPFATSTSLLLLFTHTKNLNRAKIQFHNCRHPHFEGIPTTQRI
ncbi:hypothetical protein CEXT_156431 [Caerostris extrusa]|uniref:Secreted protein n=1 Tax=Caerostris extrusa TaxID=172846 RepID=A0AAV4TWY0_CAEEX|nr:hypothetical protein CEXT_156431 [Caerostris extrusa]